jgi:bifunctional UDP-N-acetylglucosamine pyrophosphorylase/glucosamine-1-phosphate N-acetyltransferase
LVVNQENIVERIVEFKDASDSERNITLCNSGVYLLKASLLKSLLEKITPDNEAGEYYLTDIVALAKENGVCTRVIEGPAEELLGINTRVELAAAEQVLQNRWRHKWMLKGVTLQDPESVFFCHDTILGQDVVIGAHVTFGSGVVIEDHVQILPYCHMEGVTLRRGACVGPFAHLRSGTEVGEKAIIGNFVEVKNSILAPGAKAKHLSYLGNAQIGERANIGAGTITCNYNGYVKAQTTIGAYAFIGSNSSLVAPVSIGERAIVAAGSVITKDVPADSLGIQRTPQQNKENWAIGFRNQQVNNKQAG